MKRAFAAGGLVLAIAWSIGACVGDDPDAGPVGPQPDPSIPAGQSGGACTADKKCIQGLECVRGVICLAPEDGGTTPDGGGSFDATSSADGDSSTPPACSHSATTSNEDIACGATACLGTTSDKCCMGAIGPTTCANPCSAKSIRCDSKDECGSGNCCLKLESPLAVTAACPVKVDHAQLNDTHCGSCGSANEYRVCRWDSDCAGTKCIKVDLKNSDSTLQIGVCL